MKKNIFFISLLISNLVVAQVPDTTFNKYDEVSSVFKSYLVEVDEKNIDRMSKFFQIEWCTFHFGSGTPIVINTKEEFNKLFNKWKNSPKAEFKNTRLDNMQIAPVWDHIDTKLCTVDAT